MARKRHSIKSMKCDHERHVSESEKAASIGVKNKEMTARTRATRRDHA